MAIIKVRCNLCRKTFKAISYPSWPIRKFCSKKCTNENRYGSIPWNKGLRGTCKKPAKPWLGFKGEYSPSWKGKSVGYRQLHNWVAGELGKPLYCSQCSSYGTGPRMHWANISHQYKRELKDWIRLCPKCHSQYDKGNLILSY